MHSGDYICSFHNEKFTWQCENLQNQMLDFPKLVASIGSKKTFLKITCTKI